MVQSLFTIVVTVVSALLRRFWCQRSSEEQAFITLVGDDVAAFEDLSLYVVAVRVRDSA